jgi:hypothetical protein
MIHHKYSAVDFGHPVSRVGLSRGFMGAVSNEAIHRGEAFVIGDPNDGDGFYKVVKINNEEEQDDMASTMRAIVHPNTRNKTVDISIEVEPDVFLTPGNGREQRAMGEDMPVYIEKMPVEVYEAIANGGIPVCR